MRGGGFARSERDIVPEISEVLDLFERSNGSKRSHTTRSYVITPAPLQNLVRNTGRYPQMYALAEIPFYIVIPESFQCVNSIRIIPVFGGITVTSNSGAEARS
jgi:hypothetical protein